MVTITRFACRRSIECALALATWGTAGCDDGTAPEDFEVTIVAQTAFAPTPGELPGITCDVNLTASAEGDRGVRGTWARGTLRIYAGLDRSKPIDVAEFPREVVQAIMGRLSIESGDENYGRLVVTAPLPFSVEGEFELDVDGRAHVVPLEFLCGPDISPAIDTILPQVRVVSLDPPAGQLEPGDVLRVSYEAESPIGLWLTEVIVSGAVNDTFHIVESFETMVEREFVIPIPSNTMPGSSVGISLVSFDGVLRSASAATQSGSIADRSPPSGDVWLAPDRRRCTAETCQYAPGEKLMFGFDVSDNLMITWVIYRVGAFPADSFLVNSPEKTTETAPPRNPEWSGVQNVHLWLRDSSGNESENLLGETVYFLP